MENIMIKQNHDHQDDQMEMMMMTAMMQQMSKLPNDNDNDNAIINSDEDYHHQNPNYNNITNINPYTQNYHFMMNQLIPNPSPAMTSPTEYLSGGGTRRSSSSSCNNSTSMAAMREMIFRIAVMQPVHIDPESVKAPKRRNVRISKDPQSVAARHRRERISERIRILQRLVPGGTKMDTASMLDEAIHYVKFLKTQVQSLERASNNNTTTNNTSNSASSDLSSSSSSNSSSLRPNHHHHHHHHHGGIGFPVAMSTGSAYLKSGHFGPHRSFGDHHMLD